MAAVSEVRLGVLELHDKDALRKDVYMVLDDCRAAGVVVDLIFMDLQTVLQRHGYDLRVFRISSVNQDGDTTL